MSDRAELTANDPTAGVRHDDHTAAIALLSLGSAHLKKCWPAEFDINGMVRAKWYPLGNAHKIWKPAGSVDVNGKLTEEDGWYYGWWDGHLLCGDKGAGRFMQRPTGQLPQCKGKFGFKIGFPALIQQDVVSDLSGLMDIGGPFDYEFTGVLARST